MEEVCEKCGLQKDICACREIAKEMQKITIATIRRRFRKLVTVVGGFEDESTAKQLGKTLKRALACGGTVKKREIELQGNHAKKVKELLLKEGYNEESISG